MERSKIYATIVISTDKVFYYRDGTRFHRLRDDPNHAYAGELRKPESIQRRAARF